MDDVFHVVKVNHSVHDIIDYLNFLVRGEFLLLFVELVEQTSVLHILSNQGVFIGSYTHSHIEDNVRML